MDGLKLGTNVVGEALGLRVGDIVGMSDSGVGSKVVGSPVGLGVGTVDGRGLGDRVGI